MRNNGIDSGCLGCSTALADAMRARTSRLHRRAERTGFVRDLLQARATPRACLIYLANLLAVYEALESALSRHRDTPGVRCAVWPELYRSPLIRSDIDAANSVGLGDLPVLDATRIYTRRIVQRAADGDGAPLIAHAYTRYLGDLNGGQLIGARLRSCFGLGEVGMSHCEFGSVGDPRQVRVLYREAIDRAGNELADTTTVIHEAAVAFRLNIMLSEAIGRCASTPSH